MKATMDPQHRANISAAMRRKRQERDEWQKRIDERLDKIEAFLQELNKHLDGEKA